MSGVSWELAARLCANDGSDLASSDATASTPTITAGPTSAEANSFLWLTGGTNVIPGLYHVSVSGGNRQLDRPCGTVASISGGTWENYENYGNSGYQQHSKIMQIVGGKGLEQYADVVNTTMSGSNLVYTLDRPLRIPVDSTSRVALSNGGIDWAVSGNTLSGDGNNSGASCAMQLYTASAGIHFWNNRASGLDHGVTVWAADTQIWGGAFNSAASQHYYGDNVFDNCNYVARVWQDAENLEYGQDYNSSVMIRDNVATNTKNWFFWVRGYDGAEVTMQNNVAGGAASVGIYGNPSGTGFVMVDNLITSDAGSVAITGTMTITADPSPASSQFVGFES